MKAPFPIIFAWRAAEGAAGSGVGKSSFDCRKSAPPPYGLRHKGGEGISILGLRSESFRAVSSINGGAVK